MRGLIKALEWGRKRVKGTDRLDTRIVEQNRRQTHIEQGVATEFFLHEETWEITSLDRVKNVLLRRRFIVVYKVLHSRCLLLY